MLALVCVFSFRTSPISVSFNINGQRFFSRTRLDKPLVPCRCDVCKLLQRLSLRFVKERDPPSPSPPFFLPCVSRSVTPFNEYSFFFPCPTLCCARRSSDLLGLREVVRSKNLRPPWRAPIFRPAPKYRRDVSKALSTFAHFLQTVDFFLESTFFFPRSEPTKQEYHFSERPSPAGVLR